jgi:raffinose/stachyose/melibiose transport system permease protein
MKNKYIASISNLIILIGGSIISLFPVYIALLNSLKTNTEISKSILGWPAKFQFINFVKAIQKLDFLRAISNTSILTVLSVVGILVTASMAGYIIARSQNKFAKFFYYLFIASMLIPFHSIMISLTKTAMALGVKGTLIGTVAIYIGLGLNMSVFLYHGFIGSIPVDLEEAGIIDGCKPFGLFYHIVFPLLKPITATIAILNALWIWNDFLLPLLMITDSDNYTLILAANKFFGKYEADWSNILAGLLLTSFPLIIFYLIFQRHIVKGITAGAVKG